MHKLFSTHTSAYLRNSILSSFNDSVAPQLSLMEFGNRVRHAENALIAATYIAAPFRSAPMAGYVAEEAQNTFNRHIPKLNLVSSMLSVWSPRVPSAIWSSAVASWLTSTILMVGVIPFAFIFILLPPQQDQFIHPVAKGIFISAAATIFGSIILVVGSIVFSGLVSTIVGLYNDIYWADAVSNEISGVSDMIADIQMYAWTIVSAIGLVAMFSFIGIAVGIKKYIGSNDDSSSGAQQASNIHTSTASGAGGAMSGGGTNANFKRGNAIKGGK